VIRYSYLWRREQREGREEGVKDRPCAIVLAAEDDEGETLVVVVPVTHRPPESAADAIEVPTAIKTHLGLDDERSWVVLTESNQFARPGPDLRRCEDGSVAYGFLPPRFFAEIQRRFLALEDAARSRHVERTE
jgi:hypothetical protein